MTWSLSAHGVVEDVAKAGELLGKLRELFTDTGYGTLSTSFAGPGISEGNFHQVAPATLQTPAATAPTPEGTDAQQGPDVPPVGAGTSEEDGLTVPPQTPGE